LQTVGTRWRAVGRWRSHPAAHETEARAEQIGSYVVDDAAVTLVNDWIQSLQACP
jgi:hypothetical protein